MKSHKQQRTKLQQEADVLLNRLIAHSNNLFTIGLPTKQIERIIRALRRKARRQR